ncbi:SMI1/KNR4 family protein [Micromonospora chersina]|uniref:SMI1/KNR4 family protein n=1 Tax=Micromonospora chersina TaxID=47854 RepID=UPI0033FFD02A
MDAQQVRQEVVSLLREVPRAPEQPFLGGADDLELVDLERRLGEPIPAALADWLRVCKGEAIGSGGVYGAWFGRDPNDVAARREDNPSWREQGWLPVAGDGCGNTYVLSTRGPLTGSIGFIDSSEPDEMAYVVASDLWRFLRFLFMAETGDRRWPFDQHSVLTADPALAALPGKLMPWAGSA